MSPFQDVTPPPRQAWDFKPCLKLKLNSVPVEVDLGNNSFATNNMTFYLHLQAQLHQKCFLAAI